MSEPMSEHGSTGSPWSPLRRVRGAGLSLAVREYGAGGGRPHVVLVHGYPDQQDVWDPMVAAFDPRRFHVVTYDVRGAGRSDVPSAREGYRTELLVEDLTAVVEATVPDGEPVHLVGHDWGSVQLWDAVADGRRDPRLAGRIASFTSVSGPSLDQAARVFGSRPSPRLLDQMLHSWYVSAFQVPVLPDLLWRHGSGAMRALLGRSEGREAAHWGDELARNGENGLNLYRANVRHRMREPGVLHTDVPVLVVQPRRDAFVKEVMLEGLDECCPDLRVRRVDGRHWLMRSHPAVLADLVAGHVTAHPR